MGRDALSMLKLSWGGLSGPFVLQQERGQWLGVGGQTVNKGKL